MNILAKVIHGSRLYRLHNQASDYDFKSIHLPTKEECLLFRACKNSRQQNPENKTEVESFALQEILRLAARSEGVALDMLHCNKEDIIINSPVFQYLLSNKIKFYTKNMIGALGYAKSQTTHYALKAERLEAVERTLDVLKQAHTDGVSRIYQIWNFLPKGKHIIYGEDPDNRNDDKRFFEVAGKKIQPNIRIEYGIDILENLIKNGFGKRVKDAREMDNKDSKSLSHAFRMGYQLYHVFKNGGFSYPLPESRFIMEVKYKTFTCSIDEINDKLNNLITEVENLSEKSTLPKKVDQNWLDEIVLNAYS